MGSGGTSTPPPRDWCRRSRRSFISSFRGRGRRSRMAGLARTSRREGSLGSGTGERVACGKMQVYKEATVWVGSGTLERRGDMGKLAAVGLIVVGFMVGLVLVGARVLEYDHRDRDRQDELIFANPNPQDATGDEEVAVPKWNWTQQKAEYYMGLVQREIADKRVIAGIRVELDPTINPQRGVTADTVV